MTSPRIHLVTGASGFIGRHLVELLHAKGQCVWVIMRAHNGVSARERARAIFPSYQDAETFRVVEGDVTQPHLGISDADLRELQKHTVWLWHLAANLSFAPSQREHAVSSNRLGSEHAVDFANTYAARLIHVSTAYVCGDTRDIFRESDLDVHQRFRNHYEESKYFAERIVRERATVPFLVFRPSIVIGDAYEGKAEGCTFGYYRFGFMLHVLKRWVSVSLARGGAISWLLRMMGTRYDAQTHVVKIPWMIVPHPRGGVVDMVPVDHVVKKMVTITQKDAAWDLHTFHLTQSSPLSSLDVLRAAMEDLGITGVTYVQVPPWVFHALLRIVYSVAFPLRPYIRSVYWYIPYVTRLYVFDHAHSDAVSIPPMPPITREFLRRINRYAETDIFSRIHIDTLS